MELTHIWLLVEDMPRALGFYRDTLGLTVAADLGGFVELNANEHFLLSLFLRGAMRESEPGIRAQPGGWTARGADLCGHRVWTPTARICGRKAWSSPARRPIIPNGGCARRSCATPTATCSACMRVSQRKKPQRWNNGAACAHHPASFFESAHAALMILPCYPTMLRSMLRWQSSSQASFLPGMGGADWRYLLRNHCARRGNGSLNVSARARARLSRRCWLAPPRYACR